ncbi:DUF2510 domain-containing protein [Frondihabitans australicus]|uniref:Uncharacterized protein DUF2510 n=1 Tax=Frondihabitans australicus TaxID=386892 RepID=A0A495IJA8_9MICO|nr:DUF2510 domain-containing protein [Frondihabitans australicus]RKR75215.1 uncharacterized protein DUF2510 [Frondihabitans australicus]
MSDSGVPDGQRQTPAGWYQDPSGQAPYRWWDGYAWSSSTSADPAAGRPAPSNTPPVVVGAVWQRPQLPPDRPVYSVFIWLIVLLPLLSWPLSFTYTPHLSYERVNGIRTIDPFSIYTPTYFAMLGVSLALYVVTIVLAFRDQKWLQRQGVVRPFAWGWAFLGIVYTIGRSVIVHGVAPKRGLWPIWISIALIVIGLVVGFSHSASEFSQIQVPTK